MRTLGPITASAALIWVMGAGAGLAATPLPSATYDSLAEYETNFTGGPPDNVNVHKEIFTAGSVSIDNGGYARIENYPNPTLESYAIDLGFIPEATGFITAYHADSSSTLKYDFVINGPAGVYVPVDLSYAGASLDSGPGADQGYIETYAYIALGAVIADQGGGTVWLDETSGAQTFSGVVTSHVFTGDVTQIELQTFTQNDAFVGDSGYIKLDPILSIDPSFASVDPNYLKDYSIQLSPGIGNLPGGVPEPSTWVMMLAGIGVLGVVRRQRMSARALIEAKSV